MIGVPRRRRASRGIDLVDAHELMMPEPSSELRGSTLVLSRLSVEDAAPVWEAVEESKAQLMPWLGWCHEGYDMDESVRWASLSRESWDRKEMFNFVIAKAASSHVVGTCGLNQIDWTNRRANLGYWIRTTECGRGFATEAARLLACFGLGELPLMRLEIVVPVGNHTSERVPTKLGAAHEGVLRNRVWLCELAHDAVSYSLTPADLPRLER